MKTLNEYIKIEQVVEALKLGATPDRKDAARKTHLDKEVNSINELAEMCQNYLSAVFTQYNVKTSDISEKNKTLYTYGSSNRSFYNTGYACNKHFTIKFTEPSKKLSTMELTVGEHKDMFLFAYRFRKASEKLETVQLCGLHYKSVIFNKGMSFYEWLTKLKEYCSEQTSVGQGNSSILTLFGFNK